MSQNSETLAVRNYSDKSPEFGGTFAPRGRRSARAILTARIAKMPSGLERLSAEVA